jgi:hypothetical protein
VRAIERERERKEESKCDPVSSFCKRVVPIEVIHVSSGRRA